MRALLLVLDCAGCGDPLANVSRRTSGVNNLDRLLQGSQRPPLPVLNSLGLWKAVTGDLFHPLAQGVRGCWGRMREQSRAKDTTTGHWEMAGVLLPEPLPTFDEFPPELINAIQRDGGVQFLGNRAASGVAIIEEFGAEHLRTGKPILYTSADSVMQIAAHEDVLPLQKLYDLCRVARRHADRFRIGRVIARPFRGTSGAFSRTSGRREYAMLPPRTILNALAEAGLLVAGIGKIGDMFASSGVTRSQQAASNAEALALAEQLWNADDDGLIFVNLADFETHYSDGAQAAAYSSALRELDAWLTGFLPQVESDDLVIITADHGTDPSAHEDEWTRDEVPLLMLHQERAGPLGTRRTYADIAATIAQFFKLRQPWPCGRSFLQSRATRTRKG